jgi:MoxR-like ATPase
MKDGIVGVRAIKNNYINIILTGKPGTGKTTLAYALGSTFGMPTRTINLSKYTEEDAFEGKTKQKNGVFDLVSTPFLVPFKNGGIIILEEINLVDPGVLMGAIGQAVEAPFILYEDGYKPVNRHPLTVIISTMNTGTQGSREPSEAFTNRFPYVFIVDDPNENEFIQFLSEKGFAKKDCKKVYNAYKKVYKWLTNPDVCQEDVANSLSPRTCIGALTLMKYGVPFQQALENTFVGTIGLKDLVLARSVRDDLIANLPAA